MPGRSSRHTIDPGHAQIMGRGDLTLGDRCLVTGGAGFIGSAFIRMLFRDANFSGKIVNFDLLTYAGNPANLADSVDATRYTLVRGDIGDRIGA